jgi:hypothetical protein
MDFSLSKQKLSDFSSYYPNEEKRLLSCFCSLYNSMPEWHKFLSKDKEFLTIVQIQVHHIHGGCITGTRQKPENSHPYQL